MTRLRLRVEGQPLRRFRLHEVPEFIRHKYVSRVFDDERIDGLRGWELLDVIVGAKSAARRPSETVYWVSQLAWDQMIREAEKLQKSGAWKQHMPADRSVQDRDVRSGTERFAIEPGETEIVAVA